MQTISSDTNVWIDFRTISRLQLPFLLPYTYIMYEESINCELLYPPGFLEELIKSGLESVDITMEEFILADKWGSTYPQLSIQDRIALAIAKERKIILLTGDMSLRKAALKENVPIMGTLGILDLLSDGKYITTEEYKYCLTELLKRNGGEIRLPSSEIKKRLERINKLTASPKQ